MMVEDQLVVHKGLGLALGRCVSLFYTDNGVMGSWYLKCLKGAINVIIGIFCTYRPVANVVKSKAMT